MYLRNINSFISRRIADTDDTEAYTYCRTILHAYWDEYPDDKPETVNFPIMSAIYVELNAAMGTDAAPIGPKIIGRNRSRALSMQCMKIIQT